MQAARANSKGWTTADLEALEDDPWHRYEIIDGELFVTRAPHWNHQRTCTLITTAIQNRANTSGLGEIVSAPGIIFSDTDNVIPDLVWASAQTLSQSLDASGHLTSAPELIVEVLSAGKSNEERDRQIKLKLYSERGVREYWIGDWRDGKIEVYRQENDALKLVATLSRQDQLTSPLLPGFSAQVSDLLA